MHDAAHHILLIDDDLDTHEVIKLVLQPMGFRVTCCATTEDGRAALQTDRPDVLLLDIMFAGPTDGPHLAEEIRQDPALRDIPIVFVTSVPSYASLDMVGGPTGCVSDDGLILEKPLDAQRLRVVVTDLVSGVRSH